MNPRLVPALLALVVVVLPACSCDDRVKRTFPKLEVIDEMGNERGAIDFGPDGTLYVALSDPFDTESSPNSASP
jgi:hypothetical protein